VLFYSSSYRTPKGYFPGRAPDMVSPLIFSQKLQQSTPDIFGGLFGNKAPRDQRNLKTLFQLHSAINPVARMVAKLQSKGVMASHFREDLVEHPLWTCVGCRVSIRMRNNNPDWALFNGGIGTMKDIVFGPAESPNSNKDLPLYISLSTWTNMMGPTFINCYTKDVCHCLTRD
jgi:hypothetical protein